MGAAAGLCPLLFKKRRKKQCKVENGKMNRLSTKPVDYNTESPDSITESNSKSPSFLYKTTYC